MKHLKLILICIFFCITHLAAAEGGIKLTPVRHSKDRGVPYSIGIRTAVGHGDFTYEASNENIFLDGYELSCGPEIRLHLGEFDILDFYSIGEIYYKHRIISDIDILSDRRYTISSSNISAKALIGATLDNFIGIHIGIYGDFLLDFRGAPYGYTFGNINKDCLNKIIPYFVIGASFGKCSFDFEFPLNSGFLNLNRYSYYNRAPLTYNRFYNLTLTLHIRLFGSHHK